MTQETELPDTGMREVVIDSIDSCTQLMMAMAQGDKFRLVSVSNTGLTGNQRRLTFMRKDIDDPATVAVPVEVVEFLRGAGPLDGVWFGDKHPTEQGLFWWRKRLQPYTKGER